MMTDAEVLKLALELGDVLNFDADRRLSISWEPGKLFKRPYILIQFQNAKRGGEEPEIRYTLREARCVIKTMNALLRQKLISEDYRRNG